MGWTYMEQPREGWKKCLDDDLTWERETITSRVLDSAIVRRKEYYAAVEHTNKETGEKEVFCAVSMLNFVPKSRFPFGFKDMCESMGPVIDNCPNRILDLLTPTESEWANDWRTRCRAKIAHRKKVSALRPGDKFVYNDGEYTLKSKRPWVAMDSDGFSYRFHQSAKDCIGV